MVGRSRGWRDTQDGKLLLLLAAKMYLISVSGWLASWVLVCCDFRGHQKCDDSNFALIWTLPLSVIVLRMVWFSFFRVLGHRNITVVQSMPRILRSLRLLEHFCVNCTGVSATMKFRIFLISWFIFVNVFRFVVVDNTLNKCLQALCCIIRKWNYVAETAFLYP